MARIWKEINKQMNEDLYYIELSNGKENIVYRMYAKSANDARNKALKNLSMSGYEIKSISTI